jgi:hypothetical protein
MGSWSEVLGSSTSILVVSGKTDLCCWGTVRVGKGGVEVDFLDKEAGDVAEPVNDEESSMRGESDSPSEGMTNEIEPLDDEGVIDAVELVNDESVVETVGLADDEASAEDSMAKESCWKTDLFMIIMLFPLKTKMK